MKQKGFTLIELLVVVAIIGTLAAIGVVAYDGYTSNAKVSVAKSNCKTVITFLRNEIIKCQAGVGPWLNYHPNCPSSHVDYYKIFNYCVQLCLFWSRYCFHLEKQLCLI